MAATSTPSGLPEEKPIQFELPKDKVILDKQKQVDEVKDVREKRTLNSKCFQKKDGSFVMQAHVGQIHYFDKLDSKRLREIDHTLIFDEKKQGWSFKYHSYQPFIPKYSDGLVEFRDLFDDKDQTIRYRAVGRKVEGVLISEDKTNPNFDSNPTNKGVLYKDTFGVGKDYILYNTRSSLVKVATVNNPSEQKKDVIFEWEIELPKDDTQKEVKVYRAETKKELVKELFSNKVVTQTKSYELDITKDKIFDTPKLTLIGNDKKDGKEWFTYLRAYKAWDSDGNTIAIKAEIYSKDGKRYLKKTIPLAFLQSAVGRVFTDTTTSYYDTANGEDGFASKGYEAAFADARTGSANGWSMTLTSNILCRTLNNASGYYISRAGITIDTSSLPDNATINSAIFKLYGDSTAYADESGTSIVAVAFNPASDTSFVTSDWSNFSYTAYSDQVDITTWSTTSYNDFTFNSSGLASISKTGISKYGFITELDRSEVAPATADNFVFAHYQEETSADKDPYLEITYDEVNLSTGWTSSQEIKIDNTKVSGTADLTDFPVYLDGNAFSSAVFSGAKTDGSDLRFTTDSAGTTQIPFEIVSWDSSGETCEIHAKLPTVSYNTDTSFYVWYGNSSASALAATDTYGSHAVWSDYAAVYHLNEDTDSTVNDSTSNNNNSTVNTFDSVSGKIGSAADLVLANSDYISIPSSTSLNQTSFAISFWINPDDVSGTKLLISKYPGSTTNKFIQSFLSNNNIYCRIHDNTKSTDNFLGRYASTSATTGYQKITLVWSGSYTNSAVKIYRNATQVDSNDTSSGTVSSTGGTAPLEIGSQSGGSTNFNGIIDNVTYRVGTVSVDWITTEYANQNSPSTFAVAVSALTNPTLVVDTMAIATTFGAVALTTARKLVADTMSVISTFNDVVLTKTFAGYTLVVDTMAITATFANTLFKRTYKMVADTMAIQTTFNAVNFAWKRAYKLVVDTMAVAVTFFGVNLKIPGRWVNKSKNTSTYSNKSKNSSIWSNKSKN